MGEQFMRTRGYDGKASNAHGRPQRLPEVEAILNGRVIDADAIAAAERAAAAAVNPFDDIHASAYRRALVGTMVERALRRAVA